MAQNMRLSEYLYVCLQSCDLQLNSLLSLLLDTLKRKARQQREGEERGERGGGDQNLSEREGEGGGKALSSMVSLS